MKAHNDDCNVAQECAKPDGEMVMTDRELLELAAKAAGITLHVVGNGYGGVTFYTYPDMLFWNPLTDDGDALRLAVSLRIDVAHDDICNKRFVYVRSFVSGRDPVGLSEIFDHERMRSEATRRAIVRAAAEIGKGM